MDRDFIWKNIWLDSGEDPLYGEDQMYVTYPIRFPVVNFALVASDGLCDMADKIRVKAGYKPLTEQGWYDFYVGINSVFDATDNCITFIPVGSGQEDDEVQYQIPLEGEEPLFMWARLDEQARECYGKSCKELLREAEETIEDAAISGKW